MMVVVMMVTNTKIDVLKCFKVTDDTGDWTHPVCTDNMTFKIVLEFGVMC